MEHGSRFAGRLRQDKLHRMGRIREVTLAKNAERRKEEKINHGGPIIVIVILIVIVIEKSTT